MDSSKSGCLVVILIITGLVFIGIRAHKKKERIREKFASEISVMLNTQYISRGSYSQAVSHSADTFLVIGENNRNRDQAISASGKMKREEIKVLVIDKTKRELDDVYFMLPKRMRASETSDITVLAITEWKEEQVGYYHLGGSSGTGFSEPAIYHSCFVTLVDFQQKEILDTTTVYGSYPRKQIQSSSGNEGSVPRKKVKHYIKKFFS
jgi:hypothetical protein